MIYQTCSFKVHKLRRDHFHVRPSEEALWQFAEQRHSALEVGSLQTFQDLMETMNQDAFLLIAQKGGFEAVHPKMDYALSEWDDFDRAADRAFRVGDLRRVDWEASWKARGEHTQESAVVSRVLGDEHGHLSGTVRLVLGPMRQVAELFFEPGGRPKVVAVYVPKT